MEKGMVSIIIPIYNEENNILDCVESLRKQVYKNIEIIMVNDGSIDGSFEILNQLEKKYNNILIINQENSGQGIARNRGLSIAKGEYIYFLDCDDFLSPEAIKICVETIKFSNADIVTFNSQAIRNFNIDFFMDYSSRNLIANQLLSLKEYFINSSKANQLFDTVWLYFFKSKFLKDNNLVFNKNFYEDSIFMTNVFTLQGNIFYINQSLHNRVIRANSTMTRPKNEKHVLGAIEDFENCYKRFVDLKLEEDNEMLLVIKKLFCKKYERALDNIKQYRYGKAFTKRMWSYLRTEGELRTMKNILKIIAIRSGGKVVIIQIKGGIGNQLFSYASAYGVARRCNTNVILDKYIYDTHYQLRSFKLDSFKINDINLLIYKKPKKKLLSLFLYKLKRKIKLNYIYRVKYVKEIEEFVYQDITESGNIYMNGYWQNINYFNKYRDELLSILQPITDLGKYNKLVDQIKNKKAVVIHVRRGDYKTFSGGKCLSSRYYLEAIERMEKKMGANLKYYIFTDDIDYCKSIFPNNNSYIFVSEKNNMTDLEEFHLMTKCDKFIIANSTFSWWAAYLSGKESYVIAPIVDIWKQSFYLDEWETVNADLDK